MKNSLLVICILSLGLGSLLSQQVSLNSLYMYNPYHAIPAYAGFDGTLSMTAVYRDQWTGIAGSPVTQIVSLHSPMYKWKGGLGFEWHHSALGVEDNNRLSASYNYVIQTKNSYLSFGLQLGLLQKSLDGSLLRARSGIYRDGAFMHNDLVLPENSVSAASPFLGLSLYYIHEWFEGGIALNPIWGLSNDFTDELSIGQAPAGNLYLKSQYKLPILFTVHGSLLLQTDLIQWQANLATWLDYENSYQLGLNFRGILGPNSDAFSIFGGLRLDDKWTIQYAYDIGLSSLNRIHDGSHELSLKYLLNRRIGEAQKIPVIHNPRFLD